MTNPSTKASSTAIIVYHPRPDTGRHVDEPSVTQKAEFVAMTALSLSAQFADMHYLHWNKGDVVILAGTSTAGKSSIAAALIKYEPDRIEEDLDIRRDPRVMYSLDDKENMFDDVIRHSLSGRRVLVHVDQGYNLLRRLDEQGVSLPKRVVLAYCPFNELSSRLISRNQDAMSPTGDPKNARDPLVPIANFAELYTHTTDSKEALEEITRDQAITSFRSHFDAMIDFARARGHDLPSVEQIALDKENALKEFLTKLGFKDGMDRVNVGPRLRKDYTHIFNTYVHSEEIGHDYIARTLHSEIL